MSVSGIPNVAFSRAPVPGPGHGSVAKNYRRRVGTDSFHVVDGESYDDRICSATEMNVPNWVGQKSRSSIALIQLSDSRKSNVHIHGRSANSKRSGADHVVIKGFSLAPGYTDHPAFVHKATSTSIACRRSVHRAQQVLLDLGYRARHSATGGPQRSAAYDDAKRGVGSGSNIFDPEMPIGFELHFTVSGTKTSCGFGQQDSMNSGAGESRDRSTA